MNRFIAHFDILGYKEFIVNNSIEYINRCNDHIFRESQTAVSQDGAYIDVPGGIAPDVRTAEINCMHFSDTILFWTNSSTEQDFLKLVYVSYKFYWRSMQTTFAVRGAIGHGDFEFNPFQIQGQADTRFFNSSLYGKALVDIYVKAENQDWAGCFIDDSALNALNQENQKIVQEQTIYNLIYDSIIVLYPVPQKEGNKEYKHCLRLMNGPLNNVAFRNGALEIKRIFNQHMNGKPLSPSVIKKMHNTIEFLDYFRSDVPPRQNGAAG